MAEYWRSFALPQSGRGVVPTDTGHDISVQFRGKPAYKRLRA